VILANNADYSFLLGKHCLQIHSFKLDSKHDTLKDIAVKSGFKSVITDVIDASGDLKDHILLNQLTILSLMARLMCIFVLVSDPLWAVLYASEIPALETMNEMQQEIIDARLQVPEDVQLNELQDLFDAVISRGDIEIEHESHCPLLCMLQLRDGTHHTLGKFEFQDGAHFFT
jgi:hypothetical protein